MDFETSSSSYPALLRKHWLPLALALVGLIFFSYGLISLFGSSKSNEITFTSADSASKSTIKIAVDVEGAVINPGLYKLPSDAIIQDALVASGGLSSDADREFVAKNINLASKLIDGAKIYIPKENEVPSANSGTLEQGTQALININTASLSDLDSLSGIGPVSANKIIDNRPYLTVDELLNKKIVSEKVFTQIKDRVTAF